MSSTFMVLPDSSRYSVEFGRASETENLRYCRDCVRFVSVK